MILLFRKTNVMLMGLILALVAALVGIQAVYRGANAQEETVPVGSQVSVEWVETLTQAGKTVVLDAGHGGEDPGAVSSFSGAKEKDITLAIVLQTKALLEADGYTVILTRSEDILNYTDENLSMTAKRRQDLQARKKLMDESGADIVVSVHLNAFTDARYSGAQTFYTKQSVSSKKLAVALQDALRAQLDETNTREALLKSEEIIITKNCKVTTTIVECGFLSNEEEEKRLTNAEYQTRIAEAIKMGIDDYFTTMSPAPSSDSGNN